MEKLIELLNEYEPYIQSDGTHIDNFWWYVSQGHSAVFPKEVGVERIISKSYGFIKWLVDNDKIDYNKLEEERKDLCEVHNRHLRNKYINVVSLSYIKLLMLLAISDEPIKFLTKVLKIERQYIEEEQELIDLDYGTGYTKKFVK